MLKSLVFTPYTTSEIAPSGWLRRQLEIQAQGLSGNLDKIWPDIKDSKWIGGNQEGWERVPYWLDGFIPLAWLLDDGDLKKRAKTYIDAIIERQNEDGWICPCEDSERSHYDVWAFFLIAKVLVLYHDCTGDSRIKEVIYKGMLNMENHMEHFTLFNWAATRWYECLIPLFWLYERRPEEWMEELMVMLYSQGTDYEKVFDNWCYEKPQDHDRWSFMTHVVNMAMALKSKALISRLTKEDSNAFAKKAIRILLRDHGMAVDHFTGDECLSGTSPLQGSECCSVVEAMYSYEWLLAITGDTEWADRLEHVTYNALPATTSPDMWTHQYDQMTNQVECSRFPEGDRLFRTNSNESHLFGLEPNYGCCTANFNQGWPKFALSTFMQTAKGVAITAIAPAILKTKKNGVSIRIEIVTNYPFEDGYKVKVSTEEPVELTLDIRIPSHVKTGFIDGSVVPVGFVPITRTFSGEQEVIITFECETIMVERPSKMFSVRRGPLLYALPIKERWEKLEYKKNDVERKYPYCDYEVFPESKWNYAFSDNQFILAHESIGEFPFDPNQAPISLTASMVEVDWPYGNGRCGLKPTSLEPVSQPQKIKLIPYGCTNLRMTEMPFIKKSLSQ